LVPAKSTSPGTTQPPGKEKEEGKAREEGKGRLPAGSGASNDSDPQPACWICLEEVADNVGVLPVRDCSCRGDAAGYAHPSCLIAYATTKSIQLKKGCSTKDQEEVWRKCPTCKQQYQNQLSLDLCTAYVTFAESPEGKKCVDIRNALEVNISCIKDILIDRTKTMSIPLSRSGGKDKVLSATNVSIRDNGIQLCNKLLSLVLQQKNDNTNTKYMPKIMHWVADTYESIGFLHNLDQTREAGEIALTYLERAQGIYKTLLPKQKDNLHHVNTNIAVTKANLKELGGQRTAVDTLDHIIVEERRKGYERHKQQFGENDTSTISTGLT
jgi:hypothetical protein